MNVPPNLAQQLLETNFENICKKLEAGGTLTVSEQKNIERHANSRPATAPPPDADAASPVTAGFQLGEGIAPPRRKLRDFYLKPLKGYEEIYGVGERTIKRWVSRGRHATPAPQFPPLDEPPRMAAWWREHMDQVPPKALLDYEISAPPAPPVSGSAAEEPAAAFAGNPAGRMSSITLADFTWEEGEAVRRARAIEKANGQRVEEASAKGDADEYRRWYPIWNDSATLLRQLEKEDRESRKASGSLLPRAQAIAEIAQMLEALRLMREAMPAKILAALSKQAHGRPRRILRLLEPLLVEAIQTVRSRESDLLLNIETLSSPRAARDTVNGPETLTLAA